MKKVIIILLLFISFSVKSQTVSLIIGDGQSNMSGVNDISSNVNLLDYEYKISPHTYIFDSLTQNWQYMIILPPAKDLGMHSQPDRKFNANPFMSLAKNVDTLATREYYFAMHAKGGSQIYEEVGVIDWNVNSTGEHWDSYKTIIQAAINNLSNQGILIDTIFRIGFLGETDALLQVKADAFYQNESDLMDSLEANFNYPFQHFLIEVTDDYTYSTTVNGALSTIASERSNTTFYANDNFVYSGVHIDNQSQLDLGDSLFKLIHY